LPRILWLRSGERDQDILDLEKNLEQNTGLKVTVANGQLSAWRDVVHRVQIVLVELPMEGEILQQLLSEASDNAVPVPVIIYDPVCTLDETLIRPPMTNFRHVTGPLSMVQLASLVGTELERSAQTNCNTARDREPWRDLLIGESRPMRALHAMIRLVGPRQSTVLITGETGTGKEMVARAIHLASKRAGSRMVSVNCAAIPENLVEAELFGHAKGAFTGAVADRVGRFELAHRGSIFLDEVAEIPLEVQPKLLRVLQERELQRVGGSTDIQIDARVIAASNIDLEQAVAQRKFREDLLYRLNVVPMRVPPLRERSSDIPLLAEHFIDKVCRREGLRLKTLSTDALERLCGYEWPGNVRQLEHTIEMVVTLSGDRSQLYAGDIRLPERREIRGLHDTTADAAPQISMVRGKVNFDEVMGRVEKLLLQEALRNCDGNKAKAANLLGIPRTTLVYKVKSLEAVAR
jgi:DNA-binding NtrC family response regulator